MRLLEINAMKKKISNYNVKINELKGSVLARSSEQFKVDAELVFLVKRAELCAEHAEAVKERRDLAQKVDDFRGEILELKRTVSVTRVEIGRLEEFLKANESALSLAADYSKVLELRDEGCQTGALLAASIQSNLSATVTFLASIWNNQEVAQRRVASLSDSLPIQHSRIAELTSSISMAEGKLKDLSKKVSAIKNQQSSSLRRYEQGKKAASGALKWLEDKKKREERGLEALFLKVKRDLEIKVKLGYIVTNVRYSAFFSFEAPGCSNFHEKSLGAFDGFIAYVEHTKSVVYLQQAFSLWKVAKKHLQFPARDKAIRIRLDAIVDKMAKILKQSVIAYKESPSYVKKWDLRDSEKNVFTLKDVLRALSEYKKSTGWGDVDAVVGKAGASSPLDMESPDPRIRAMAKRARDEHQSGGWLCTNKLLTKRRRSTRAEKFTVLVGRCHGADKSESADLEEDFSFKGLGFGKP